MQYNNVHYVIALLKAYGIKTIVASPGTQNSYFNYMVQEDSFFRCFSVLDERSAAYMATGLALEAQKPVVITCTGATASRNYMSAMTEAFYRKIPIIALTFIDAKSNKYNMAAQFVDRSVTQNDIKTIDVTLPMLHQESDVESCLTLLNAALSEAVYNNNPVHIDTPSFFDFDNKIDELPPVWKTEQYDENFIISPQDFINKKIGIFIGSHKRFTPEEENAISSFAEKYGVPIFCDHTSNYYGKNKFLTSKLIAFKRFKNLPDIIIDIGNVSGDYTLYTLAKNAKLWRISNCGKFQNRGNRPLEKLFNCTELTFFRKITDINIKKQSYYEELKNFYDKLIIPDLPLCNALICQTLAKNLPDDCNLHISILNSLRNANFFEFKDSVSINCNVGGFGIDGAVSSLVGQSLNNKNKNCFGLIGDTAFFYDMNAIGNRDIKNNLRIIMINNGRSVEFRLKEHFCEQKLGEKADVLIAAANHNKGGAKGWAESCGFKYICANNKDEFLSQINSFCNDECDKPIFFEVFTKTEDEQNGLKSIYSHNKDKIQEAMIDIYKKVIK